MGRKVIVGFGEGVHADGTPSKLTLGVADTAFHLLRKGYAEDVVFAGHSGYRLGPMPRMGEADGMWRRLIARGADWRRIRVERESRDTVGNTYYAKRLIEAHLPKTDEIMLIASWQHMYRARVVAEMVFGPNYTVKWTSSPDPIWGEELIYSMQAEKLSLEIARMFWDEYKIKPGEHEKIWNVLTTTHPAYTDKPKISEKQRELMAKLDELRRHCSKFQQNPDQPINFTEAKQQVRC
ncbi:MAG: YdcF family protein [Candidatus Micrarchaeota archaeon]|nr:YdcF family protein [Candidatus Micrarchaeota archaeon]